MAVSKRLRYDRASRGVAEPLTEPMVLITTLLPPSALQPRKSGWPS